MHITQSFLTLIQSSGLYGIGSIECRCGAWETARVFAQSKNRKGHLVVSNKHIQSCDIIIFSQRHIDSHTEEHCYWYCFKSHFRLKVTTLFLLVTYEWDYMPLLILLCLASLHTDRTNLRRMCCYHDSNKEETWHQRHLI